MIWIREPQCSQCLQEELCSLFFWFSLPEFFYPAWCNFISQSMGWLFVALSHCLERLMTATGREPGLKRGWIPEFCPFMLLLGSPGASCALRPCICITVLGGSALRKKDLPYSLYFLWISLDIWKFKPGPCTMVNSCHQLSLWPTQ